MLYLGLWWDRWHPEATSRPVLLLDEKLRSGLRSGQRRPLGRDRTAQSGLYSAEESVSGVLKCKKRYYVISALLSTEGEGGGEGEGVKRAGGTLRGRSSLTKRGWVKQIRGVMIWLSIRLHRQRNVSKNESLHSSVAVQRPGVWSETIIHAVLIGWMWNWKSIHPFSTAESFKGSWGGGWFQSHQSAVQVHSGLFVDPL